MALKISIDIPEITDASNPEELQAFTTAVRQAMQEIISKAQQVQDTVVTVAPATTDFEIANQAIPFDDGANRRIYYFHNGSLRYSTLT